jgi:hypothetical protein
VTNHEFIFSNEPKYRVSRHVVFWLLFSLHFIIQNLMIGGPGEGNTSRSFFESARHLMYFLPLYLLSTYLFIGMLLPRLFFKRRYLAFLASFIVLFAATFTGVYYAGVLYLHQFFRVPYEAISYSANKYHAVVDGFFVPFMLLGIATGIKLSKKWLLQQRRNENLAKQKLATELQLLKTSVHPRFLFHSLQTVQRYIDNSSTQSPAMILQLSDLLSYILYEKDENWVPVAKEFEIISCYIDLEQKGYEGSRSFRTDFANNTSGKFIIPFLLLSVVEACFEYFFETRQEEPLLTLIATIEDSVMHFELFISRATDGDPILLAEKLEPHVKQLRDQYPGLNQFGLSNDKETIAIMIKLPLYSRDLITTKHLILDETAGVI